MIHCSGRGVHLLNQSGTSSPNAIDPGSTSLSSLTPWWWGPRTLQNRGCNHQCISLSIRYMLRCHTPVSRPRTHMSQETLRYARPAFPICKISPVGASSLRSTGHEAPSALISVSSSLDPITLKVDLAVSMAPYKGKSAVNRFGGESDVFRSKAMCFS